MYTLHTYFLLVYQIVLRIKMWRQINYFADLLLFTIIIGVQDGIIIAW